VKAGQHNPGHRYGCWGTQRGGARCVVLQTSFEDVETEHGTTARIQIVSPVHTQWNELGCGHDFRHLDMACTGCPNLGEKKE